MIHHFCLFHFFFILFSPVSERLLSLQTTVRVWWWNLWTKTPLMKLPNARTIGWRYNTVFAFFLWCMATHHVTSLAAKERLLGRRRWYPRSRCDRWLPRHGKTRWPLRRLSPGLLRCGQRGIPVHLQGSVSSGRALWNSLILSNLAR